jgi:hypothetical protein
MAIAIVEDVATRLGRELDPIEVTQARVLLDDAESILLAKIPDLHTRITLGTLSESLVVMVESNAVCRVLRNPDGLFQETDGNYSYQVAQNVASGRLSILREEWEYLGVSSEIFVISPKLDVPWDVEDANPWMWS